MPRSTPSFPSTRTKTVALVMLVVAVMHVALFLAMRVHGGERLAHIVPFADAVQYIDSPNAPQIRLLANVRKEPLELASNTHWVQSMDRYADLPAAQLVVAKRQSLQKYASFAYPKDAGQACVIQFTVDTDNQGAMAYSMMQMASAQNAAPYALRLRLNEYEALHELAHCLQAQRGYPVAVPGLAAVENTSLAAVLVNNPTSPMVAMYRELFADAYAMHRFMAHYQSQGLYQQSLTDMRLLLAWRIASIQDRTPLAQAHATAPMVAGILVRTEEFLAMPAEEAATRYASMHLVNAALRAPHAPALNPDNAPKEALRAWERALALGVEFSAIELTNINSKTVRQNHLSHAMAASGW